jgi:hypothetical protein
LNFINFINELSPNFVVILLTQRILHLRGGQVSQKAFLFFTNIVKAINYWLLQQINMKML